MTQTPIRLLAGFIVLACGFQSLAQEAAEAPATEPFAAELNSLPAAFAEDLRKTRAAVIALQSTEEDPQQRSDAWGNLGMIYHGQQLMNAALDAYQRALVEREDARWHYLSSVIFLSRGEVDKALAYLQQTVLLTPDYAAAWYRLGTVHTLRGDFEQAKESFLQAQRTAPNQAATLVGLADVEVELGNSQQAIDYLSQAWAASPDSGQIAYKLAQIYRDLEDQEKYDEWIVLTQGVLNPPQVEDPLLVQVAGLSQNSRFYVKAADWAIQQGDIESAITAMKSATEVDPENADLKMNYVMLLFMAQQQKQAVDEVKQFLSENIASSRGWYLLGWMLSKSSDPEQFLEGLVAVQKSLELEDVPQTRRLVAAMLIGVGKFDEAETEYDQLLKSDAENAYYHYWFGLVQLAQDKCEGIDSVKRALVLKKDWGEAHISLARAEALCGQIDKAVARIDAIVEVQDSLETRLAQAYVKLHAGHVENIKEIAEAALPHPDAQLIMNALDANEKPSRLYELGSPGWIPQELRR